MDQKNIADCPECGTEVRLKKAPFLGQRVVCRRCGVQLRVVSRQPLYLRWADDSWEEEADDRDHKNRRV